MENMESTTASDPDLAGLIARACRPAEGPSANQGRDVIEEAAQLLNKMAFSTIRGSSAEGKLVSVSIAPRLNDDGETVRVLVHCRARGHRSVNWEGLPVWVWSGKESGLSLCLLNARGQACIPELRPGDYQTAASPVWGESAEVVPMSDPKLDRYYESKDGDVSANVIRYPEGETVFSAETSNPLLSGATVLFSIYEKGVATARLCGRLVLEKSSEVAGKWVGRYVFPAQPKLAFQQEDKEELVFSVIAPTE